MSNRRLQHLHTLVLRVCIAKAPSHHQLFSVFSILSLLDPHVSRRGWGDLPLPPCTAFALCQCRLLRPDASRLSRANSSGACVGYGERACRVLQPLARDPGILIFGPPQPVLSSSGRPAPTCKLMQRLWSRAASLALFAGTCTSRAACHQGCSCVRYVVVHPLRAA